MLIELRVKNFLSFKDEKVFSMVSSSIKENQQDNVFSSPRKDLNLLKSAIIYGANASGKSNLIKAFDTFKYLVVHSFTNKDPNKSLPVESFLLSTATKNKPSMFEISFFHEKMLYRYGFEIDKSRIINEWLFANPKSQMAKLFVRENKRFDIKEHFKEGKGLKEKTRDDALFLAVCAQFNGKYSNKVIDWFKSINIISSIYEYDYMYFTRKLIEDKLFLESIKKFVKIADSGIKDYTYEKIKITDHTHFKGIEEAIKVIADDIKEDSNFIKGIQEMTMMKIKTLHNIFDNNNKISGNIYFDLEDNESEGTKKLFNLSGTILYALDKGKILIVDEFETKLHLLLSQYIIHLFNSKEYNTNNAQLIITTHDTNLMSKRFFRRDQIWLAEKDKYGATDLYTLADYKHEKVRSDQTYSKNYIQGRYGAIPFIGDPSDLFGDINGRS